ncbi:hypothetical protein D3C79_821460 [compost metagenome]
MQHAGQAQQWHRQGRTTALAQAQAQGQQRLGLQGIEQRLVPWFGTLVGKQQPSPALRVEAHGYQRGDAADETVHQHRNALLCTGQVRAGQGGDLKTTHTGQRLQRVVGTQTVQHQGPLDHFSLVAYACGVQASARATQFARRAAQQGAGQRRSSRGIADAHLATDEQLRAALGSAQDAVTAGLQG